MSLGNISSILNWGFSINLLEVYLCCSALNPLTRAPREGQGPSIIIIPSIYLSHRVVIYITKREITLSPIHIHVLGLIYRHICNGF